MGKSLSVTRLPWYVCGPSTVALVPLAPDLYKYNATGKVSRRNLC